MDVSHVVLNKSAKLYGKLQEAVTMYENGESVNSIAKRFNMDSSSVCNSFKKAGVKMRGMQEANILAVKKGRREYSKLSDHASWKGGTTKHDAGYVRRKSPGHHRAEKHTSYVFDHILVAEKKIGRKLKRDECVHHINGIKDDNRQENIEVMTKSEHMSFHMRERRKNARK